MDEADFERALGDPAAAFAGPEDIARHPGLDPGRKRALLERWRAAHGAGGAGGDAGAPGGVLERIGRALAFLDTETGGREQTHEQVLHGPGVAPDLATPGADAAPDAPEGGGRRG